MARIRWKDLWIDLREGETVLQGLLRSGIHAPYHCQVGGCQTCLLRVIEGTPPEASVEGLSPPLQGKGYFFACICVPDRDLVIEEL